VSAAVIVAGVGLGLAGSALLLWALGKNVLAASPRSVARHIREPGMVYKVRLGTLTPAWNPQRPYVPGDRLMGPGRATYWMDESNIVHLTLHPKWGPERHFAGPLPEGRTSHRTAIRLIVGGYVLLIVTGFLGGYFESHGSSGHRWISGGIGVGISMVLAWLLSLYLSVGSSVRSLFRREAPR